LIFSAFRCAIIYCIIFISHYCLFSRLPLDAIIVISLLIFSPLMPPLDLIFFIGLPLAAIDIFISRHAIAFALR